MNLNLNVPDELVEAIAERVAERLGAGAAPSPLLTVDEAADYLRCGRKRIYDLTSQRRIAHLKDGSRTLIRRDELDRYLQTETELHRD